MEFSTILLTIFMVMFWLFRAIVALCTQYSIDFLGIVSYNLTFEIILSFIVIVCIILVVKRQLIGALAYLLLYGLYYGGHLLSGIASIIGGNAITITTSANLVCDLMGVLLAIFCVLDMLVAKNRKYNYKDKKTDWYFKNEHYEEELKNRDKRDDTNQYRFY